jgi:hypothetical protein
MIREFAKNTYLLGRNQRPEHVEEAAIVETSLKARQAFLDPPVLVVLCASLAIAISVGFILWSSNL